MELKVLNDQEIEQMYERHMKHDFPPSERKSLASIRRLVATGHYDVLAAVEGEHRLGYALVWTPTQPDRGSLVDYLAVLDGQRNGGLGGKILDLLEARYTHIYGEVEAPITGDEAVDDLRRRRLAFYARNKFRQLNYDCALFGVHYRCVYRGPGAADEDVMHWHQQAYAEMPVPQEMRRYLQIPLHPGETILEAEAWLA